MSAGKTLFQHFCAVTSFFFSIYYLTGIFAIAMFRHLFLVRTSKSKTVILSKEEKRLIFDLGYYLNLHGFELQHYNIKTCDKHILKVNRIVKPNTTDRRYPVLLIPGLMQSSSAYCTSGADAIALVLARAGYDVWLGNNRGGFHPECEGRNRFSCKMWDWSMDHLAKCDVPAMVSFVQEQTGTSKVALGAHSQGTTQSFIALSKEQMGGVSDLGSQISSFSALAPAVYAGPLVDRWFLRMLRINKPAYRVLIGYRTFMGIMTTARQTMPLKLFTRLAYIVYNYMLGWDDTLWDIHYRDRNFIFAPVMVSSKLMFWWLGKNGFADTKCIFSEQSATWFDESFPPLQLFECGRDNLVLPGQLINRIRTFEEEVNKKMEIVPLPSYSHLDVLWASDSGVKVALPMVDFIWKHVEDKENWTTPSFENVISKE